jgi:hypothetical protein
MGAGNQAPWRRRRYSRQVDRTAIRIADARMAVDASPCAKKAYIDKGSAKLALKILRALRRGQERVGLREPGKCERTAYRCGTCGLWHLTSQPKQREPRNGSRPRRARPDLDA